MVGTIKLNSGGNEYIPSDIINHPNYNTLAFENDICILKTASSIVGSNVVASIPIGNTVVGGGVDTIKKIFYLSYCDRW